MSFPAKSPAAKSAQSKKKGNSIMLPGLDNLPRKKGSKSVVVVVVKGGGTPPNLSNLPFMLPTTPKKKKGKKGSKKKKTPKKEVKKASEEDEDSDSDRITAPDLPKVHTPRQTGGVTPARSDRSPSTPETRKNGVKTTKRGSVRVSKIMETIVIKDGSIDSQCVPMFICIDGPVGCPIIVPLDARDSTGLIPESGPQPLLTFPSHPTKGYLVVSDEGLLHFKPLKECPAPPPGSNAGTLHKFLNNSNIFIADSGPKLPDEKSYIRGGTAAKDKIGQTIAVSGYITIVGDKGTCKFTRVNANQKAPFYPTNAAMGVLVRDHTTGLVFWVPTENRFVGSLLSKNISILSKQVAEMTIVAHVYKQPSGLITCESSSPKSDTLIGFVMSSATGVPIYAARPPLSLPKPTSSIRRVISPPPVSVTDQSSASPSLSSPLLPIDSSSSPPSTKPDLPSTLSTSSAVAPLPTISSPAKPEVVATPASPPQVSSPTKPAAAVPISSPTKAAAVASPAAPTESTLPTENTPSFGWSLLSTLGSVLNTTASVISTTSTAVTEAAGGGGATLPSPQSPPSSQPQSTSPAKSAPATVPPPTVTAPPPAPSTPSPSIPPLVVPIPVVAKNEQTSGPSPSKEVVSPSVPIPSMAVAAPAANAALVVSASVAMKNEQTSSPGKRVVPPSVLVPSTAAAAPAAAAANAAPAVQVSVRVAVADAASNGGSGVKESTSTGECEWDHKSYTDRSDETSMRDQLSDQLSEGGVSIGDQMASIYRNLLASQSELPPESESSVVESKEEQKEKDEESKKDHNSVQEEASRKAENKKEYKKFLDDRSESFSPYGYR